MPHTSTGLLARLHAAAARFCANAAMLVHVSVALAFITADSADCRTSIKHALGHLFI